VRAAPASPQQTTERVASPEEGKIWTLELRESAYMPPAMVVRSGVVAAVISTPSRFMTRRRTEASLTRDASVISRLFLRSMTCCSSLL